MPRAAGPRSISVTRRVALKALGASAGAAMVPPWMSEQGLLAFSRIQETKAAPNPRVLSASQFATLESLAEAIIPSDDRSPGARDARVADYIDLLLSESPRGVALQWIGGLGALDAEAVTRFGAPFARLAADQADGILADVSRNERAPATPLEAFFVMAKRATVQGYYTSEIGIHQELRYQGNTFLREFTGCLTEDGKDCPHCRQKVRSV